MNIQKIALSAINPAKYNPRKDLKPSDSEYQHIKNSIQDFGYIDPLIWNEKTGNLVGGHQRFKILKELGYIEAECVIVNFDEIKEKAANLALNQAQGDWDIDALNSLLNELKIDYNMSSYGFEMGEIDMPIEATEDDFDFDKEIKEVINPVTQEGEIYKLGRHYLMCGDSTKEEDVIRLMQGHKAQLIVTDPPYNVDIGGKCKDRNREESDLENDNLTSEDFKVFLIKAYSNIYEVMDDAAAIYVFHADTNSIVFRQEFLNAKLKLSEICIWVKNSMVLGRQDYHWQHEPIIYGWKPTGPHKWYNDRKQTTVWFFDRPVRSEEHPTMKPVSLISYIIGNSSKENDIIFDGFGGSGTSLIASEQTKRTCYIMEIKPKFCDVIIKRFEQFTGIKAEKV